MTARARFDFTGTSVLLTGGTSGIGHATAMLFREAGARVTVTGTRSASSDYDVDLDDVDYARLDLCDPVSIDALASRFSVLDVLVNNVGAIFPRSLDEKNPDGFAEAVTLNLTGPYRLTAGLRRALAASTAVGGASVVNFASMSALRAVTHVPGYGSGKAGIIAMSRTLAVAWARHGIRVNVVAPGTIDTPMIAAGKAVPEILDTEIAHIPQSRLGIPSDIAPTVAFLCTEHSSYTTGALFIVDGGSDCM